MSVNQPKHTMKKIIAVLSIAATVFTASAQTNSPIAPPSFFNTAEAYLTSFNPAYSWNTVKLEVSSGYKQVTGANASSVLDVGYDFNTTTWINGFSIQGTIQFSGVGSAINSGELGLGYAVVEHLDTKVDLVLLGGYDGNKNAAVIEPGIFLKKKLTENTFAETGFTLPVFAKGKFNSSPSIRAEVGFTY